MSKNKKNKIKLPTLDLHGIKHENVEMAIEEFILSHILPCEIIVGNSSFIKNALKKIIEKHNLFSFYRNQQNLGAITITESL